MKLSTNLLSRAEISLTDLEIPMRMKKTHYLYLFEPSLLLEKFCFSLYDALLLSTCFLQFFRGICFKIGPCLCLKFCSIFSVLAMTIDQNGMCCIKYPFPWKSNSKEGISIYLPSHRRSDKTNRKAQQRNIFHTFPSFSFKSFPFSW